MSAYHIWREDPPPRSAYVWAKYSLIGDSWQLVKTCKRGCCVYSLGVSMTLPAYWREATTQEAESAAAEDIVAIERERLWSADTGAGER
jgi:hypothetical protein